MIDNVYIDLALEKKGYSRYGNYAHLSHIKKTFIMLVSIHSLLTENTIMIITSWSKDSLLLMTCHSLSPSSLLQTPPSTITCTHTGAENARYWLALSDSLGHATQL